MSSPLSVAVLYQIFVDNATDKLCGQAEVLRFEDRSMEALEFEGKRCVCREKEHVSFSLYVMPNYLRLRTYVVIYLYKLSR